MITKEELKEIVDLCNSVPDKFQVKCFELVLTNSLKPTNGQQSEEKESKIPPPRDISSSDYKLPITLSAFIGQYKLNSQNVLSLFHIDKESIVPIYNLTARNKKQAQTQLALLLSLENALSTGKFSFDQKLLRTKCEENKIYDYTNFKTYLKQNNTYYKNIDDDEIFLTPEGKTALADLLETLTKSNG